MTHFVYDQKASSREYLILEEKPLSPTPVSMKVPPVPEIVTFAPDDPDEPRNWPSGKKVRLVAVLCVLSFAAVFGSSSYAPGEQQVEQMFNVNVDVASLGLSVYVLGFAFGPLLCKILMIYLLGPMSEIYGRQLPFFISWPLLIAVLAPSVWVDNLGVILFFRFLSGICAACSINNGTGFLADMYAHTPLALQKALGFYIFCPLSGPIFGTVVGFFVAAHLTHGLWVIRIHWFFVIAVAPLILLVPETHGPTILARRAARLRAEGYVGARAAHELKHVTRAEYIKNYLGRPLMMLLIEPIVIGAAIWVSLAYSIVYFFFQVFPVVFIEHNHFKFELGGLPFLAVTVGMLICLLTMAPVSALARRIYIPGIDPPGGTPPGAPEAGLKVALIACAILPISMFWFAWSSTGNVHWMSPVIASVFFGYSMLVIFYTFITYTTQVYRIFAASATASNTLARSIIASIFPVIANPIISNLGTDWGVSLFGFLSFALFPIPLIFVRYGPALRARSRFARESDALIAATRSAKESEEAPKSERQSQSDPDATLNDHDYVLDIRRTRFMRSADASEEGHQMEVFGSRYAYVEPFEWKPPGGFSSSSTFSR